MGAAAWRTTLVVAGALAVALGPAPSMAAPPVVDSPVTDLAGVLGEAEEASISEALVSLREGTGVQMAALLVQTTAGQPIEDYAQEVFDAWGGGSAERDDGVLFVLAIADRRSRLHTGYGLEPLISDSQALAMLHALRPALKRGDHGAATAEMVAAVAARVAHLEPSGAVSPPPAPWHRHPLVLFLLLAVAALAGWWHARRRAALFQAHSAEAMAFTGPPLDHAAWTVWLVVPTALAAVSAGWAGPGAALTALIFWGAGALYGTALSRFGTEDLFPVILGGVALALCVIAPVVFGGAHVFDAIDRFAASPIHWFLLGLGYLFVVVIGVAASGSRSSPSAWSEPSDSWSVGAGASVDLSWQPDNTDDDWGMVGAWATSGPSMGASSSASTASSSSFGSSSSSSFGSSSSSFGGSWSGGGGTSGGGGASSSW